MAPDKSQQVVNMLPYLAKEIENVINITKKQTLKQGDYPRLSGWAQYSHMNL